MPATLAGMRALLIANPAATSSSARQRDVLVRALGSETKVEVAETRYRGHAARLAAEAVEEGRELVVAFGGDGTVNEVVNGLLTQGAPAPALLGVVPGGGANSFARAVGLPTDPMAATGELLAAIRAGEACAIALGRADDRWFTFTAGLGLDATAVRLVERTRRGGGAATPAAYLRATVRGYLRRPDRRHGPITLTLPGREPRSGLHLVIASNTTPWTWYRDHPVHLSPRAGFDHGLDLIAMRRFGPLAAGRASVGMVWPRGVGPRGRAVVREHDVWEGSVTTDRPMDFEVDGEYLGERTAVTLRCVPEALRVLAPTPGG
jgi:diacylglycerol kinase family enzyme